MRTLFHNWGAVRWIRLGLALVLLMAGITSGDAVAYAASAFVGLQALFNFGCCGAACTTDSASSKPADGTNIVYEEVKG
jgi:hypothetical protein